MSRADKIVLTIAIVVLVDLIGVGVCLVWSQSQCFAKGYPSSDMDYRGVFYCTNQLMAVPLR
jgi:hypothetical protein